MQYVLIFAERRFAEAFEEALKDRGCRAWILGQHVELYYGEYEANVVGALLQQGQDLFKTEFSELRLSVRCSIDNGERVGMRGYAG